MFQARLAGLHQCIGFNPQKTKKGLGFRIFEERTKELNGILNIKSEQGKGTTIEVIFEKTKP